LERFGRLPELQIDPDAISSSLGHIRVQCKYHIGLVDAESITEHIVGLQILHSTYGMVEVIVVVAVEFAAAVTVFCAEVASPEKNTINI
jgi:hypothetical protein